MESNRLGALAIELKENILFYLPSVLDQYNLAQACTEFNEYLQSNIVRSLDFSFDFHLDDETLLRIFFWLPNPSNVTHLNLNGLYWIDAEIIKYATIKFTNLESLFLVDTKVYAVQENLEVLSKAKKLHIIAIESSNSMESNVFKRSFVLVRNDNQQPCINERHKLQGNIMTIEVRLSKSLAPDNFLSEGNWINGLCNSPSFKEFRELQLKNHTENRMTIDYNTLLDLRDRPHIRDQQNLLQVTELFIRDHAISSDQQNLFQVTELFIRGNAISTIRLLDDTLSIQPLNEISLKPITYFKNLCKLDLGSNYGMNITDLNELLTGCEFLKSLKIAHINTNLTLNLYSAKSLEEVSFYTEGDINFNSTFSVMGPPENVKLKRILLKCKNFHISSYENFKEFLNENTGLLFFHVECIASNYNRETIKRTMEDSRKRPSQHFEINMDPNPSVKGIPLSHIDMIPLYQCNLCFYKS